jgi:hypothetical protein
MKIAQPVKFGAWLLIVVNLIMAFGSIWIFMRMAPAIEVIIAQNEDSLKSCENMLAALAKRDLSKESSIAAFQDALAKARNNITENQEPAAIARIDKYQQDAFRGDPLSLTRTISAITDLGEINRKAMNQADVKAKQFGYAGAWGVVFMATVAFLIGILFLRSMDRNLSAPIHEIDAAVTAFREGNRMRRCTIKNPSNSIRKIFDNINELLDIKCIEAARNTEKGEKEIL